MISVILVAAGKGVRMKGNVPKQYMDIAGQPLIAITLNAFDACPAVDTICLVLSESDIPYFKQSVLPGLSIRSSLVLAAGGDHRQASVYNGLLKLNDTGGIVLIHDGVRPFVTLQLIMNCIEGAKKTGACIAGIPAFDTLKRVDSIGKILQTVKRDDIILAQTPQAFSFELIKNAHELCKRDGIRATDDASIAEYAGIPVTVVRGLRENIKITTPEDLKMARALFSIRNHGQINSLP